MAKKPLGHDPNPYDLVGEPSPSDWCRWLEDKRARGELGWMDPDDISRLYLDMTGDYPPDDPDEALAELLEVCSATGLTCDQIVEVLKGTGKVSGEALRELYFEATQSPAPEWTSEARLRESLIERCRREGGPIPQAEAALSPPKRDVVVLAQVLHQWKVQGKALDDAETVRRLWKLIFRQELVQGTPHALEALKRALGEDRACHWSMTWRADPGAAALADRHYNRQKQGAKQFAPPGRALVLMSHDQQAMWVTSWPYGSYQDHDFGGWGARLPSAAWGQFAAPWINSTFRNEGAKEDGKPVLSSELIRDAVAVSRWWWGETPSAGLITFVDPSAVKGKRDPGYTYLKAGWTKLDATTSRGLLVFHLAPERMPDPKAPRGVFDRDQWVNELRAAVARGEVLERSVVGEQARRAREATRTAREALVRQVA
jgi:hypothetical protein